MYRLICALLLIAAPALAQTNPSPRFNAVQISSTLQVLGTSTLAGVVGTTGTFSGDTSIGGTLSVTGPVTLNSIAAASAAVSGNATVGGTFGVTGASTLAALSATTGTFSGAVTVGGNAAASASVTFNAASASDRLALFTTAGVRRWSAGMEGSTSAWVVGRYDGSGVYQGNPISIANATGNVTMSQALTVNSTSVFGRSSARYIQAVGDASNPTISVQGGTGTLVLRGNGAGQAVNLGTDTGGGAFRVIGASSNGGSLDLTQPSATSSQIVMSLLSNTKGVQWNGVQQQFVKNWTYSGTWLNFDNRPFSVQNTISGTSGNTSDTSFPITLFTQTYQNYSTGQGSRGLQVWSQIDTGSKGAAFTAFVAQSSQIGAPGTISAWAGTTAYNTVGQLVLNDGKMYYLKTAGMSASSGGPTGTGSSIADGTCVWAYGQSAANSYYQIGAAFTGEASYNVGGTASAPIGSLFGGVVGATLNSGATYYSQSVAFEIDNDMRGSANRSATLQLVQRGLPGTKQDWGLSLSSEDIASVGATGSTNALIFQNGVDADGYGIAFENQITGDFQSMAGAFDMRMVQATGSGQFGGGFLLRGPNWSWVQSGAINLRYGQIAPTSSGLSLSVPNTELTAAVPTGDGANWSVGNWAKDQYGNVVQIATESGNVPATVTIQVKGQVDAGSVPATSTFYPMGGNTSIPAATGSATWPTPFTATLTYAPPVTPTIEIGTSGGILKTGSDTWTANGSVATTMTSLGPTGSHTTIQEWFTVTNASGAVRYIPAY